MSDGGLGAFFLTRPFEKCYSVSDTVSKLEKELTL